MDFRRNIVRGLAAAAAIAAATISGTAQAATTQTNLSVTANVTSNCGISTLPVAFGDVDTLSGVADDATGRVTVTCTNGAAWTLSAGAGTGAGATLAVRKMTLGANVLNYALYTDSSYGTIWGNGSGGTGTIAGTGTGSAQPIDIHGRVPTGQGTVPAGGYSDLVVVTITYP